ncbi:hypothetical protein FQZ97_1054710 [compost metagenome]
MQQVGWIFSPLGGLAHGVQMKGFWLIVGTRRKRLFGRSAEQRQGLSLTRGSEGVASDALLGRAAGYGGIQQTLLGAGSCRVTVTHPPLHKKGAKKLNLVST